VLSPLIMIGIVIAAVGLWRSQRDQPRVKLLLSHFLPIQIMYLVISLNSKVLANWIAPSLISGIVLLVVFWKQLITRIPARRWTAWSALGVASVMTVLLHAVIFVHLPLKLDPLRRAEGWTDFAQHIQNDREEYHPDLLISKNYEPATMMQFYLQDHPFAYMQSAPYGTSQFTLWPGYTVGHGTSALFVAIGDGTLSAKMKEQFNHSQLVDDLWSKFRGRPTTHFRVYFLQND